jgi:hypothetical protein
LQANKLTSSTQNRATYVSLQFNFSTESNSTDGLFQDAPLPEDVSISQAFLQTTKIKVTNL